MILSARDGGRDCPSACEVWIRDVLDLYDQGLSQSLNSAPTSCTKLVLVVDAGPCRGSYRTPDERTLPP
jgi:hypothetical protein